MFPKKSAKIIDGSEECKRQLAFDPQNSRVYERCSKGLTLILKILACFLNFSMWDILPSLKLPA